MPTKGRTVANLPCVNVIVNENINIPALIDSGASYNILSLELFEQLLKSKHAIKCKQSIPSHLMAANETPINVINACDLRIKIGKFTWWEKFLVIESNRYKIILGMPFLQHKGLCIDFQSKTCHFKFEPGYLIELNVEDQINPGLNAIKIGCVEMQDETEQFIAKYPSVFTDQIGEALDLEIKLEVTDPTPVSIRPYNLSPPAIAK